MGFGLTVWILSYMGLFPILNFKSSAYKMTGSRNALMIVSHVVWGCVLGYSEAELSKKGTQIFDGGGAKMQKP